MADAMDKARPDQWLVDRGLADSRTQAPVLAGLVYLDERKLDKTGRAQCPARAWHAALQRRGRGGRRAGLMRAGGMRLKRSIEKTAAGAAIFLICLMLAAFAALPPAAQARAAAGPAIGPGDAVVLGTSNKGRVNFVILTPHPEKPGFSGFHLRGDLKEGGVVPGRYMIGGLFFNSSITSYSIIGALYGGTDGAGEVEVKAGEAVYIGHLVFNIEGRSMHMSVEDRFEEFRKRLPPDLAAKVQKRLIRLPASLHYGKPVRTPL